MKCLLIFLQLHTGAGLAVLDCSAGLRWKPRLNEFSFFSFLLGVGEGSGDAGMDRCIAQLHCAGHSSLPQLDDLMPAEHGF